MSLERKLEKVGKRKWNAMRDAWMADIPTFPILGARPDPGLEKLPTLQAIPVPGVDEQPVRHQDVEGIRRNALWEAIFLFQKCAHASLAAQRLGERGMHSWSMFNAYHAAFLGAKGVMALLGVAVPSLDDKPVLIDLFPEPSKSSKKSISKIKTTSAFQEFQIIRLQHSLDQQGLWEALQRILRVSAIDCWDMNVRKELVNISIKKITPPRNGFLYRTAFWPLEDLMSDGDIKDMMALVGTELNADDKGFLLRLCFSVYRLFEQLMCDLGRQSDLIRTQVDSSRVRVSAGLPVLEGYAKFVSQMPVIGEV